MLIISVTTDKQEAVQAVIDRVDRLGELIVLHSPQATTANHDLLIDETGIHLPLSWNNSRPPYLLPETIPFLDSHLLGLIFHLLENDQQSWQYLNGTAVYPHIEVQNNLKYGLPIPADLPSTGDTALDRHNEAIIQHYTDPALDPQSLIHSYREAIRMAQDGLHAAFSIRELATFLLDQGALEEATNLLEAGIARGLPAQAEHALKLVLIQAGMQQLVVPYQPFLIERLKTQIWESLTYFEETGQRAQVGLLLLNATHIANISASYTEALGYIRRAIDLFEAEGLQELAGSAQMRKGTLLYTWAQNGNPQFYKPAVEAYQQALYVFTKEVQPYVFAEIHHNLAVLYAEMPADNKRKSIWAGVASASFHEALGFYTKESYPYEYGSICNNFGNAFTQFPPAIHSNNHEKALNYYTEALSVRTAAYPYERAITLLNYLEASWHIHENDTEITEARYQDMLEKAREVKQLVDDPDMMLAADDHLNHLAQLGQVLENHATDA